MRTVCLFCSAGWQSANWRRLFSEYIKGVPHGKIARLDGDAAVDDTFMRDLTGSDPARVRVRVLDCSTKRRKAADWRLLRHSQWTHPQQYRTAQLDGTTDSTFQNGLSGSRHAINRSPWRVMQILIGGTSPHEWLARNKYRALKCERTLR